MTTEEKIRQGLSYGRLLARKPKKAARALDRFLKIIDENSSEAERAAANGIVLAFAEKGLCCRCGRALTDPKSVGRQIGPECLRDIGGPAAWEALRARLHSQEVLA